MATKKRSKLNGAKKPRQSNGAAAELIRPANVRWLGPLGMYPRKRALTFETEQDLKKAIDAIWNPEDELYRMPHAPAGGLTMIVPDEALPFFRSRPLRFTEHPVMPAVRRP
ncbi:MAG TPA: hypothetical protein VJ783_26410 [Pirellulales bacterium]|nr:hypothetical protein [Pirellulales bacterium]